jgi:hypothetical protein
VHTEARNNFGKMLSETFDMKYIGHGIEDDEEYMAELNKEWTERHGISIE